MAFYHANMALQGLHPDYLTTYSVATMGHFTVDVIIEPVTPERGVGSAGGAARSSSPKDKYKVTIRVSYKDRQWSYESVVDRQEASVMAKMLNQELVEPIVTVDSVTVTNRPDPIIDVEKK